MKRFGALVCVFVLFAASCGSDSGSSGDGGDGSDAEYTVRAVPGDYETIQAAVDASESGDLVLISGGVYTEDVTVEVENLVIRGLDRNEVIIDGEFERENGIKVFSDGVAVENLTVRNHTANGVFFTGEYNDIADKNRILTGYRASYITAYNNGLYGVYAFNATTGQFDNSYGSGHPDSAFYIGQCNPCNALLTDLEAEKNMLGYSGSNSTGVTIVNSEWWDNRAGIVPNSWDGEELAPNDGTFMYGNYVHDNNAVDAPDKDDLKVAWGNGIVLGGVSNNIAERNLITGHENTGLVVTDMPHGYKPEGNSVVANVFDDNQFDIAYLTVEFASKPFGNCWSDNVIESSFPEGLEEKASCPDSSDHDFGDVSDILTKLVPSSPPFAYEDTEPPTLDKENMADAATAAPVPATADLVPAQVDVAAIETPKAS